MASEREKSWSTPACPEHGDYCSGATCCCADLHPPTPEAQPMSETRKDKASDAEILEWAERHDLRVSSATDARAAFEDAQTLHLTRATPTPPEQGKVRAAVRGLVAHRLNAIDSAEYRAYLALVGLPSPTSPLDLADALLARVPAEGVTAEPWDILCSGRYYATARNQHEADEARAEAERILPHLGPWTTARATPPAAETGEPVAWTVTRNGGLCCDPMNNEQSAQRIAAEYRRMDPSGEFIVQALVLAAPAPREVSEAMVEAAIAYDYSTWRIQGERSEKAEAAGREFYRGLLRAALSAETGTPT